MKRLAFVAVLAFGLLVFAAPPGAAAQRGASADSVSYTEPGGYKVTVFYDTVTYPGTPYAASVKKQQSTVTVHAGSIDLLDSTLQSMYGFGLTQEARDYLASQSGA